MGTDSVWLFGKEKIFKYQLICGICYCPAKFVFNRDRFDDRTKLGETKKLRKEEITIKQILLIGIYLWQQGL